MKEKIDSLDLTKMSKEVVSRVKYFSNKFNIPLESVIESIIIDHWSRQAARIIVEGPHPSRPMPEFEWEILSDNTRRLVNGESLFDTLTEVYKQEFLLSKPESKGSTTSYLPDKTKSIMDEAMAEANKLYELAKTQSLDEAKLTIAKGKQILQDAVNKTKK